MINYMKKFSDWKKEIEENIKKREEKEFRRIIFMLSDTIDNFIIIPQSMLVYNNFKKLKQLGYKFEDYKEKNKILYIKIYKPERL